MNGDAARRARLAPTPLAFGRLALTRLAQADLVSSAWQVRPNCAMMPLGS